MSTAQEHNYRLGARSTAVLLGDAAVDTASSPRSTAVRWIYEGS
jgi:hypothetical protein